MHHKKRKQKDARAGCKMCKPWKANGYARDTYNAHRFSDYKKRKFSIDAIKEVGDKE